MKFLSEVFHKINLVQKSLKKTKKNKKKGKALDSDRKLLQQLCFSGTTHLTVSEPSRLCNKHLLLKTTTLKIIRKYCSSVTWSMTRELLSSRQSLSLSDDMVENDSVFKWKTGKKSYV